MSVRTSSRRIPELGHTLASSHAHRIAAPRAMAIRSPTGDPVELDFGARTLTIKLVYYGPALSGKTTNLNALHGLMASEARGRLMTLDTRDDRTLFFDLLPLRFRARTG